MSEAELPSAHEELATIARRIRFVYFSIVFAVISALFVALIAGAFIGAFVRTDLSLTIAAMFVCAMLALIVCLLLFLKEIFLAVSTRATCHGKIISRREEAGPWHIRSSESGRWRSSASRELERRLWPKRCSQSGGHPRPGSVERGTTVCDYTPLEKQLQHSLKLALASFEYQEHRSPARHAGYPDFLGQALPAFAAVETAAIVINAQNGIEMMTGRCSPGRPSAASID